MGGNLAATLMTLDANNFSSIGHNGYIISKNKLDTIMDKLKATISFRHTRS